MTIITSAKPGSRRIRERRIIVAVLVACAVPVIAALAFVYGPVLYAVWSYAPQEGDVTFQSLPRSPVVVSIEGSTKCAFSHCGIVARRDGKWIVYEALQGVSETPLREFLFRGRNHGFAVYRLKDVHQPHIPATLEKARDYLGRPYDIRYRLDDEKIYCSELIYKAYRDATDGEELGQLVRLGDLDWQPYAKLIERFEKGPVPLDREMITPKDLALAEQLEPVIAFGIDVP